MLSARNLSIALATALSLVPATAFADAADKAACADLAEGDDCTRGDGTDGVCIPDESDPAVLTCDDSSAAMDGSSGGGCSVKDFRISSRGIAASLMLSFVSGISGPFGLPNFGGGLVVQTPLPAHTPAAPRAPGKRKEILTSPAPPVDQVPDLPAVLGLLGVSEGHSGLSGLHIQADRGACPQDSDFGRR